MVKFRRSGEIVQFTRIRSRDEYWFQNGLEEMVRPARLELATPSFVGWCSVQLSYRRARGRSGTFNYSSEEIGSESRVAEIGWKYSVKKCNRSILETSGRVLQGCSYLRAT